MCDCTGKLLQHPIDELQQLIKDVGMEGRVRIVACGVCDNSHLTEIWQMLKDCTESGYWLILHNVHLAQGLWTGKLLYLLQVWFIRCRYNDGLNGANEA